MGKAQPHRPRALDCKALSELSQGDGGAQGAGAAQRDAAQVPMCGSLAALVHCGPRVGKGLCCIPLSKDRVERCPPAGRWGQLPAVGDQLLAVGDQRLVVGDQLPALRDQRLAVGGQLPAVGGPTHATVASSSSVKRQPSGG